jgi:hypothetical protein
MLEITKSIQSLSSTLSGWGFVAIDAYGRSDGRINGWKKSGLKLINAWDFKSGLSTTLKSSKVNYKLLCINIYGP